jgi:cytochrome c oxidase subunit 4
MTSVHVAPLKVYCLVFLALIVLTAVTVAAAFVDLGALNTVIMIAIAGTKATLVVLYFMHVRYGSRLIPLVILSSIFWLAILFVLLFCDYANRGWLGVEGR